LEALKIDFAPFMMGAQIPTSVPEWLYSGDTLQFTTSLTNYPHSDGWSLAYYFVSVDAIGKNFSVNATPSTAFYSVSYPTNNVEFGIYNWCAKVSLNGVVSTVDNGQIEILPSLTQGGDIRSQAKRTLDNINAVIEGRASSTILESIVEGTRLGRIPHKDLLELQQIYQVKVRNEEIKRLNQQGKPTGRTIFASFTRPRFDGYTGQL
jgi:hypothetical protein